MNVKNVSSRTRTIAATGQTVEPGGTVEVDAELGRSLCDQPDVWAKATSTRSKSKKTADDGGEGDDR